MVGKMLNYMMAGRLIGNSLLFLMTLGGNQFWLQQAEIIFCLALRCVELLDKIISFREWGKEKTARNVGLNSISCY